MAILDDSSASLLANILNDHQAGLLSQWMEYQLASTPLRADALAEADLRSDSKRFLGVFAPALQAGAVSSLQGPAWDRVRELLSEISQARAERGFSSGETATFVFSLKQPLFDALQQHLAKDPAELAKQLWITSVMLDKLGLFTMEAFQKSRERIIKSQQEEMLELSTPVVELFEGVLALPLIGTLDSARTQVVMENLLNRIVSSGASIAILDITGVPTVDTLVAQHLLKTVAAARLMGADCIISGIRPQIAQTIVHLGVELQNVVTKASLADALMVALHRTGHRVVRTASAAPVQ